MIVLFPVWFPYTEVVREKTEAREAMGGQFSSRDDLWSARVAEFESSLFGELVFECRFGKDKCTCKWWNRTG